MFIRQVHYLIAVAREGHFGRAAEACHVSQPTLSAGIRKLEEELGVPLVIRGHRFEGLTEQGERVLQWAQRIAADYDSMRQDISGAGAGLTGLLRIGAIPAALPALPPLINAFCTEHPRVKVQVHALPSTTIQRGLDDLELDVGLTYLEEEQPAGTARLPLYEETYAFITRAPGDMDRDCLSWAEALERPLCLLTRDMQNRRILDRICTEIGLTLRAAIETTSFEGIWSIVSSGLFGSIVPMAHASIFPRVAGVRVLSLEAPVRSPLVGVLMAERDPAVPVAAAFMRQALSRQALSRQALSRQAVPHALSQGGRAGQVPVA